MEEQEEQQLKKGDRWFPTHNTQNEFGQYDIVVDKPFFAGLNTPYIVIALTHNSRFIGPETIVQSHRIDHARFLFTSNEHDTNYFQPFEAFEITNDSIQRIYASESKEKGGATINFHFDGNRYYRDWSGIDITYNNVPFSRMEIILVSARDLISKDTLGSFHFLGWYRTAGPTGKAELIDTVFAQIESRIVCNVCNRQAQRRCGACFSVYYCGTKCQTADWNTHQLFCK